MRKVLLPWPTDKELAEVVEDAKTDLEALRKVADVDTSPIPNEKEWFARIKDVYVTMSPGIPFARYRDFLNEAKELKMIQTASIGYNHIDIAACTEKGVVVCNVAEVMAESVAQHTWGLILDVSKNISRSDRVMRAGGWRIENRYGIELYGKTLGLVGIGDIGGRVALKGKMAFGMRILAYDPYVLPARAQLYGAELVDLETLLKESDVISVHTPLTTETQHLIGRKQFSLMKSTAIFVNTSRGPVVDEAALAEALEKKQFLGAGIDVFEQEPLSPTSPLRKMENIVLTPHTSSSTKEAFRNTYKGSVNNILRFVNGQRPNWVVNREVLMAKR
jgi:D-3-phosphoglycerate dehydrogenase